MTDVLLRQTDDGGEIQSVNGQIVTHDGLESSVYLSLFGGNEQDSGLADKEPAQWWGNLWETDPAKVYRSETQYLLRSIPAIPFNLRRIEDANMKDLAWMLLEIAGSVKSECSIPAMNAIEMHIEIEIKKSKFTFDFLKPWLATQ